jgi:glycosyltransferase involved in cell wall biosynthesis
MASTAGGGLSVLAVTNLWPVDGGPRGVFVREQVDALRRLGVYVDVEVVAQGRGKPDYLLAARRIRNRVRTGGYDLVHVHYGMTAPAARFAGAIPRVLSLYGSDVNTPWQRWVTRLGSGGLAARLYVSRRLAETAGDPGGHVVPNGVDFALFSPQDRLAARTRLGLPLQGRVVLFGGHPANPVKDYDLFRDVIAKLHRHGCPAHELVLTEAGQSRADVVTKFAAADVLLFTSRRGTEGSPTVVKEAAVMGLPVVTVDVGDVNEVLAGVVPSAVVAFPDPWGDEINRAVLVRALAERVADVLRTPMRSNGRERCAALESSAIATRVIEVYRDVLARPSIAASRTGV